MINWMTRLELQKGARIVTVTARTPARMRVTGNPYRGRTISKVCRYNGVVNFDYEKALRKRLQALGENSQDVQAGNASYEIETHEDGRMKPFCRNRRTGQRYLRMLLNSKLSTTYVDERGNVIPTNELQPYLQDTSDRVVPIMTIKVENLVDVKL